MFSGKTEPQQKKQRTKPVSKDNAVTILTSGCHFNGKLYCRGSSRIGGRIEGQVVSEGLLIVEEGAVITADITADEAIIQGEVHGRLKASQRVELCNTSNFQGDIIAPVLAVNEGAQFNGRSCMASGEDADKKLAEMGEIPQSILQGRDVSVLQQVPEVNVSSN